MAMAMAMNLNQVVSSIVSNPRPRNKFKGSFTTHSSSRVSFSKTSSSSLKLGIGICPPLTKLILAPNYSTLCSNHSQKLLNHHCRSMISDNCDDNVNNNAQKVCEPSAVVVEHTTEVINRLCNFGLIDSASSLLEELVGISCMPDVATYTMVIDSLFKLGREDYASKLMIQVVDAYCKEGRVEDAESVLMLMIERGICPDEVVFGWVIEVYCLQGNMSKSKEVFDLMRHTNVLPNVGIYNSLINGYFKDSEIEEAMHLFEQMVLRRLENDAVSNEVPMTDECTYNIVFEGLCNNDEVEEAVNVFHYIGLVDKKICLSTDLYNMFIERASKSAGNLSLAMTLYSEMTFTKRLQLNAVAYAAMILGFCEKGLVREAKDLFLEMKEKGCMPNNVTCLDLLLRFAENKQRDIVEMLVLELEGRGFGFDASTVERMLSWDGPVCPYPTRKDPDPDLVYPVPGKGKIVYPDAEVYKAIRFGLSFR